MHTRISAAATVVICLLGLVQMASAEDDPTSFRPFNGLFANLFDDNAKPQPKPPATRHNYESGDGVQYYSAASTRPKRPVASPQPAVAPPADPPADPPTSAAPTSASVRRPLTTDSYTFQWNEGASPSKPLPAPPPTSSPVVLAPTTTAAAPVAKSMPLYERLQTFRQSPFADEPETASTASAGTSARQATPANSAPSETIAQPSTPLLTPPQETASPLLVPPSAPKVTVTQQTPPQPLRAEPQPLRAEPSPIAEATQEPSVLVAHKSPQLGVETIGPRKIAVGKEAAFEVLLQNSGDQAAEEVAVSVGLPNWAEIAGTASSSGEVVAAPSDRSAPCRWLLPRVEAHSKEKLTLKIVPKQSKPFELAVRWDFKPAPSQTLIEVQEPKLAMTIEGPREVLFGKKELYRLKLSNSGNGVAENVTLTLMPLCAGEAQPVTHRMGTIAAGDQRTIEVELTAKQAGKVSIRAEANGDGGAHIEVAEDVLVHRGALRVEAEGPAMQFVGVPANYAVVVHNPGDAAANHVTVSARLPVGMKFVSGSDGAKADSATDGGNVRWSLDHLAPGERRKLQMKCALAVAGPNRVDIASTADDDLTASADVTTRVEAVADLRLEVKEPDGPVPVGAEALYELHLRNRGTKSAENVEVLAYFSQGVEPVAADGQTNHIRPGEVAFDPIVTVPPATEVVLKVKAKALVAGNHVFRAEVHCKSAGTRLVREEMTHYYQNGAGPQQGVVDDRQESPAEERTAERQAPLPLPQSSGQPMPTPAIKR